MAKAKGLEGVGGMFAPHEGAAAVERVAKGKRKAKAPAASKVAPVVAEGGPFVVTTVRFRAEHLLALKRAALERAWTGRADVSAGLRGVLDGWLQGRA